MRSRQTAAKICKVLGKDKATLNYQLAEMVHSKMFPKSPVPMLKAYENKR